MDQSVVGRATGDAVGGAVLAALHQVYSAISNNIPDNLYVHVIGDFVAGAVGGGEQFDGQSGASGGECRDPFRQPLAHAEASALPVMLYNNPPRTSVNVRPWPERHRRASSASTVSRLRRNSPAGSGE